MANIFVASISFSDDSSREFKFDKEHYERFVDFLEDNEAKWFQYTEPKDGSAARLTYMIFKMHIKYVSYS